MVHVLLSGAMSLDGFIDDASPGRLSLSGAEDFAAVDVLRAECDAILVGAGTLRADNPRLILRDRKLADARVLAGKPPDPAKVTLTRSKLDPALKFFSEGRSTKFVYCPQNIESSLRHDLSDQVLVVPFPHESVDLKFMLTDLYSRGIRRLLVEGGSRISTQFFAQDLVDELRLAVAPFFVGEAEAPRFVQPANFPAGPGRRMLLEQIKKVGDMAVMHYRVQRT